MGLCITLLTLHLYTRIYYMLTLSFIEIIFCIIIAMIVMSFMFNVASFVCCLNAARAPKPLPIATSPVDGVLISIVNPIFVLLENHNHTSDAMGWQIKYV